MKPKARVATAWLDGCSGCHMSFLDMDERLIALAEQVDLVYSPLVDTKEFPSGVDVTLVEGAVSSTEDERRIRLIRDRTRDGQCPLAAKPSGRGGDHASCLYRKRHAAAADPAGESAAVVTARPPRTCASDSGRVYSWMPTVG